MRDKQGSRCKIQWGHHTVFPGSLSLLKAPMSDDLDDFLDLLTYTCPITGQQRCAVSAATIGSNGGMREQCEVSWFFVSKNCLSFATPAYSFVGFAIPDLSLLPASFLMPLRR